MEKYSNPLTKNWEGIVTHSIAEYIGGVPAEEFLKSIGLSYHFFVNTDYSVSQMVSLDRTAKHAGLSRWKGMKNLNSNFIGLAIKIKGDLNYGEFVEKINKPSTFTEGHYNAVSKVCYSMMSQFPTIKIDNIVGHSEVSGIDVRPDPKVDPGKGFNMNKLISKIQNIPK